MRVYIQNKLFSLRGNSTVKNDAGQDVLVVKGKLISPTRKKRICDMQGNVLFTVRNKYFRLPLTSFKAFVIEDKKKIARVKKPIFTFKTTFNVEGVKDEITIDGNFFGTNCQIVRNGVVIGTISRQLTLVVDSFCLEGPNEEIPFLTALVIAIDNISDRIVAQRN